MWHIWDPNLLDFSITVKQDALILLKSVSRNSRPKNVRCVTVSFSLHNLVGLVFVFYVAKFIIVEAVDPMPQNFILRDFVAVLMKRIAKHVHNNCCFNKSISVFLC